MKLAVDVQYDDSNHACIAGVTFNSWTDSEPANFYISHVNHVDIYVSGQFFRRELPCILELLSEHHLMPEYIVIDGYVYLDGFSQPGLGKRLFDALHGKAKIIGVAKNPFIKIDKKCELLRRSSKKPLYITSIGETLAAAKSHITWMHGAHRIPTMLKKADQLCRQKHQNASVGIISTVTR